MTKTTGNFTDFVSFSRASGGTALRRISYGSELVTNGTFDTDTTGWTAFNGAGLSVVSGKLRVTNGVSGRGGAGQAIPTVAGKVYTLTLDGITSPNSTNVFAYVGSALGNGSIANLVNTNGTGLRLNFVAQGSETWITVLPADTPTGDYNDFDNISVKEVLFDRADGTLQLFNHPTNVPRVEYDASGNLKGLLIEEARTNLFNNGNTYINSSPGSASITLTTTETGPVGSSTYVTIDTVTSAYVEISNTVSVSGSITTMTIFVKKGLYSRYLALRMQGTYPSRLDVTYDLDLGVVSSAVGTTYAHVASSIIPIGDGWFRVSATVNPVGSNLNTCYVSFVENSTGQIDQTQTAFPRDGYIAGAQLEVGAFPTSYIPTSGATATRAADICSIATSAFGYNPNGHTFVVEATGPSAYDPATSANYMVFRLQNAISASYETIRVFSITSSAVGVLDGLVINSGSSQFDADGVGSFTAGTPFKAAIAAKNDNFAFMSNGQASVDVDTSGTLPADMSLLYIGCTAGPSRLNGHIKSIAYYPRRLTNAQIQALTA